MKAGERVRGKDQTDTRLARQPAQGRLDLRQPTNLRRGRLQTELGSPRLRGTDELRGNGCRGRVEHECDAGDAGRHLLEQLDPFAGHARLQVRESGGVAARTRQARHEALGDRLADPGEHDRNGARRLLCPDQSQGGIGQDQVRRKAQQFRGGGPCPLGIGNTPPVIDREIATDRPSQLVEALLKRRDAAAGLRVVLGQHHQHADAAHAIGRLRARGERPGRRAAEKGDEIPPPHSITSSARTSNEGGTSRPSALAVTRLMARSNLVGCSTGRSAGFAPFRILST